MSDESVTETVQQTCKCGRPATIPSKYGKPKCIGCHLVSRYAHSPPRSGPGNIGDWEIDSWMRGQMQKAIEEMVSLMRADLNALADKWNPPPVESTQDGNV